MELEQLYSKHMIRTSCSMLEVVWKHRVNVSVVDRPT